VRTELGSKPNDATDAKKGEVAAAVAAAAEESSGRVSASEEKGGSTLGRHFNHAQKKRLGEFIE
jgi:hypothetical protein